MQFVHEPAIKIMLFQADDADQDVSKTHTAAPRSRNTHIALPPRFQNLAYYRSMMKDFTSALKRMSLREVGVTKKHRYFVVSRMRVDEVQHVHDAFTHAPGGVTSRGGSANLEVLIDDIQISSLFRLRIQWDHMWRKQDANRILRVADPAYGSVQNELCEIAARRNKH
ncbi:hypothetical protein IAQ61_011456, partial [Plenodomus lingam]|uniref:uncharacterized protein n=1 Tax=Leptosphaeria maculans TaxID=5022 RepID=UPI00332AF9A5